VTAKREEDETMTEKSADVINNSSTPGYTFAGSGDTLLVDFGVLVYSSTGQGAISNSISSTLINHGYLASDTNTGAEFRVGSDIIRNAPDGTIRGEPGISVFGNREQIFNDGTVIGTLGPGVFFGFSSIAVTLVNTGFIYGGAAGITTTSLTDNAVITNSGRITGASGITIDTGAGVTTTIVNQPGGSITGSDINKGAIDILSGGISLTNAGLVQGSIVCEPPDQANITIRNTGTINGLVILGGGNDLFNGKGAHRPVEVVGGDGDDRLIGGKGNDTVNGNGGHNTLTGGPGHDHFLFDTPLDPVHNTDRVTDFKHGVDKIDLGRGVFTNLNASGALHAGMFHGGPGAQDADDRIIYNPANGWLIYDSNGSGPGHASHFATLALHLTLTSTDFEVLPVI
jgi:Ca2+-binding RTX toxin-like protein